MRHASSFQPCIHAHSMRDMAQLFATPISKEMLPTPQEMACGTILVFDDGHLT